MNVLSGRGKSSPARSVAILKESRLHASTKQENFWTYSKFGCEMRTWRNQKVPSDGEVHTVRENKYSYGSSFEITVAKRQLSDYIQTLRTLVASDYSTADTI